MALVPRNFSDIVTFTRASAGGRFNSSGLYESLASNQPRLDFDPVTLAARGLLIEEQRTNLLLQSNAFSTAPWAAGAAGDAVVTANSGTAPDGTNSAFLLNDDSNTILKGRAQTITITSGSGAYTGSVFAKAGTSSVVSVRLGVGGGTAVNGEVVVNIADGSAQWRSGVSGTSFAVNAVGGGWYRIAVTVTDNGSGNNNSTIEVRPAFASTYSSTADAAATGTALFFGAQLEAGSFATSYIPTTTAQVTRAADVATINALSPFFNAAEGTLYVEAQVISTAVNRFVASITDGSVNNEISLYANSAGVALVNQGGAVQASLVSGTVSPLTTFKEAVAYKANDINLSVNGGAVINDASAVIPSVSQMALGRRGDGTFNMNGWLRKLTYYPSRLTNAQLQSLTA